MGGQAGEVRATGARGRTNRAGPRSSTRGVYTHDAAAAVTRREMYFSTIAVFFHLLLGGYYSTTTCGYYSTTARFSFHPASAHDHVRSRVGLIPKQQPSPSVGYYSTTTCGYYSTTARFSFFSRRVRFLFSTCAFRASARSPDGFPARRRLPPILPFPRELRCCRTQSRARGAREERGGSGPPRVRHRAVARRRARTALARAWLGSGAHRETRGKEERKLG